MKIISKRATKHQIFKHYFPEVEAFTAAPTRYPMEPPTYPLTVPIQYKEEGNMVTIEALAITPNWLDAALAQAARELEHALNLREEEIEVVLVTLEPTLGPTVAEVIEDEL